METISTYKAAVSQESMAKVIDVEPRELQEDEVLVKVMASPINPSDKNMARGVYGIQGKYLPYNLT